jgi:hypothetical protein
MRDVRFTPNSGHSEALSECPLCANSGHWHGSLQRLGSGYFDAQRNADPQVRMTPKQVLRPREPMSAFCQKRT